ncbi:MAG: DedA family protein [Candidatus Pacebacteria bacterium]|nr:DedA family protein [Candidatus Paceibacterota bacterium]
MALFLVAYLAALILPLPSNTSLLAASAFASQGFLNIYLVIIVALLANVLGDITGFFIAHRYGKGLLINIGLQKVLASKEYKKIETFIETYPRITIFTTRFFGGVGPIVNILTGLSSTISFRRFFSYGVAGEIVYVFSLALTGYFLGDTWEDITSSFSTMSTIALLIIVLAIGYKLYEDKIKQLLR